MISFVVPAHNEEAALGRTLGAIHKSAQTLGIAYEIVVSNDASTDATERVALENGARVIQVSHRQIAATRNSGARAARGERIFFVDADTTVNPRAVGEALRAMDRGAVGGGGPARMEGPVPLYVRVLELALFLPAKLVGFCGGAFMFCTREAFQASGGFDQRMYCGEEGAMGFALKRLGQFTVVWTPVLTSGRRFRTLSGLELLAASARLALKPFKSFTTRATVQKIWYDSNRERDNIVPGSLRWRISNAISLCLVLCLVAGPFWNFIPWSLTPSTTLVGKFRMVNAVVLNHIALGFWLIGIVLAWNLIKLTWSREWLRLAAVVAFTFWQAWESTRAVIWIWSEAIGWMMA